ncbi:MAG: hypothetical protein U0746_09415 [Gemmataceae bacterium]
MEPTQELVDDIYRTKVLTARRVPPADKLLDGARLFDYACSITRAGIRSQNQDADEARVEEILRQRLALRERMDAEAATRRGMR